MRTRSKLLLGALAASVAMLVAVGTASANNLSISEDRGNLTWTELTFTAANVRIECPVTLEGSFHDRTITKEEVLIGAITGASVGDCVGEDQARALTETLPWHVTFGGWTGTLPTIETVTLNLIGAAFFIDSSADCLARTETGEPGRGIATINSRTHAIIGLEADPTAEIDLEDTEFLCDLIGDSTFSGRASVENGEGGSLLLTLI